MGAWSLKIALLTIPSVNDLDPRDKGLRPVGMSEAALGTSGHKCTLGGRTLYTYQEQTLRLWVCYVGVPAQPPVTSTAPALDCYI